MSWPAEIDVFLAVGELALYVAASPLAAFAGLTVGLLVLRMNRERPAATAGAAASVVPQTGGAVHGNGLRMAEGAGVGVGVGVPAGAAVLHRPDPPAGGGRARRAPERAPAHACCTTRRPFTERLPRAVSR